MAGVGALPFATQLQQLYSQTQLVLAQQPSIIPEAVSPPREVQRRLTPAEQVELARTYQAGATMAELANRFGVHKHNVSKCLHDLAVRCVVQASCQSTSPMPLGSMPKVGQ